jgi:NAD(P)H-dependent FMN reductase
MTPGSLPWSAACAQVSFNRQLAEAAVKHAPDGIDVEIFEGLAQVPLYSG